MEVKLLVICMILTGANASQCTEKEQGGPYLYFADKERDDIFRMPTCGGKHEAMNLSATTNIEFPFAIAYDAKRNYIYWTEITSGAEGIGRLTLENGMVDFMQLPKGSGPLGLGVDSHTGLLYLSEDGLNLIQVLNFTGTTRHTIVSGQVDQPGAIVVDNENDWLYWCDEGSTPKIEKARLNGSARHPIVTTGLETSRDLALALDQRNSRLYFCEANTNRSSVQSVNLEGDERQIHFRDNYGLYRFIGVALDDQFIYLASWNPSLILRLAKDAINTTGSLQSLGDEPFAKRNSLRHFVLVKYPTLLSETTMAVTETTMAVTETTMAVTETTMTVFETSMAVTEIDEESGGKSTTAGYDVGNEYEGKDQVSIYVLLALIPVAIFCIFLAVFCFKRGAKSVETKAGRQLNAVGYECLDDIKVYNLPSCPPADRI